jgi:branched-chain amino acid transport system ATP-binding protein
MTASLVIEGVQAGYGAMQVLWGVDMQVDPGQTVLLLGANSAGKSTLLRTLIGLLPCTGGRIMLDDERIDKMRPDQRIKRGIAFMSELGVFPTLSIDENIALGGYFMPQAKIRQRREVLFELFPALAEKRRAAAASLSGGQRKMLGIAKVLISEPRLLLMDEPSSGLAPVFVKNVIDALRRSLVVGFWIVFYVHFISLL